MYIFTEPFARDVKSTAELFKSWGTCMDKKTCKIVAICGIVAACIFGFMILFTLARCVCMGLSCAEAICCCCRRRRSPRMDPYYGGVPEVYARKGYEPMHEPRYTKA